MRKANPIVWFCAGIMATCFAVELYLLIMGPITGILEKRFTDDRLSESDLGAPAFYTLDYLLSHPPTKPLSDLTMPNPIRKCKGSGRQQKFHVKQRVEAGRERPLTHCVQRPRGGIQTQRYSRGNPNRPLPLRRNMFRSKRFSGFGAQSRGKRRRRQERSRRKWSKRGYQVPCVGFRSLCP